MNNQAPTLVISNYNTVPLELIKRSDSWVILDQSDDPEVVRELSQTFPPATFSTKTFTSGVVQMPHVGHNLLDYLWWIRTHAKRSRDTIAFIKGNIVPRHVRSWSFLDSSLEHDRSPLWFDPEVHTKLISNSGLFIERNNSWYVRFRPYKYFGDLNAFARFFIEDWESSRLIEFCPGACLTTSRESALRLDPVTISGLERALGHDFFPTEAYFLERIFHQLVWGSVRTRKYEDEDQILEKLEALANQPVVHDAPGPLRFVRRGIRLLTNRR